MAARLPTILLAGGAFALTACDDNVNYGTFSQPAGASLDQGAFGNATMNNTLVQNGERTIVTALQERFAAEVDPMINFPFDSIALTAPARATLARQATWIQQFPEVRFRVYGHTDLVGSDAYNRRLGQRRAEAAVNYLVGLGVERSRLEAVVSFGETRPLVPTGDAELLNRRTVTEVVGFVSNHPVDLNGKYAEVVFREYIASAVPLPIEEGAGGTGEAAE